MAHRLSALVTRTGLLWILILFAGAVSFIGCAESETDRLLRMVPGLSEEMGEHLLADDEAAFSAYCLDVGIRELFDAHRTLMLGLDDASTSAYDRTGGVLLPHLGRIFSHLATDYGCSHYLRDHRYRINLSTEDALLLLRTTRQASNLHRATDLSPTERVKRLQEQLEIIRQLKYAAGVAVTEAAIAEVLLEEGRREEHLFWLRRALGHSEEDSLTVMTCQLLGVMGAVHAAAGRKDSMAICWNRAGELARRHHLPEQSARITSFFASHYAAAGRLALASELHGAAIQVCREYKGGYLELRFVLGAMNFHAQFGFWDVVGRLLQRASVLARDMQDSPRQHARQIHTLSLDLMRARYLMEKGKIDEAVEIFEGLEPEVQELSHSLNSAMFFRAWSSGLLSNFRVHEAVPILQRSLTGELEVSHPVLAAQNALELAAAQWSQGDEEGVRCSLRHFEELAHRSGDEYDPELLIPWLRRDGLVARLLHEHGNRKAALDSLKTGLLRLRAPLLQTGAAPQGYLFLEACNPLRHAIHAVTGTDPMAGYVIELAWRRLARSLGRAAGDGAEVSTGVADLLSILDEVENSPGAFTRSLPRYPPGTNHLLYLLRQGRVLRWWCTDDSVMRDTLDWTALEFRDHIAEALEMLSTDPGNLDAPIPLPLRLSLRELASALLPPEILSPRAATATPSLLFVSTDGPLSLLPFAVLNLSEDDSYVPVLMRYEVAGLRSLGPSGPASGRSVAILADPRLPPLIRRRYPGLDQLRRDVAEAEMVASHFQNARVLAGTEASKEAFLALCETSSLVHVAAHFIRDPEAPYLTFLPLWAPGQPSGNPTERTVESEDSYLGIEDIRSVDLSRCGLAILSGCASGAPYVTAGGAAPGLGDAFLDAGAGAVIQTQWSVRDEEAFALMSGFMRRWNEDQLSPVAALSRSQREIVNGPHGARHPYVWAAYTITLGALSAAD